jgi:hypothetical protein
VYAVVAALVAGAYLAAQVWWKRARARVVARALEREEGKEKTDAV